MSSSCCEAAAGNREPHVICELEHMDSRHVATESFEGQRTHCTGGNTSQVVGWILCQAALPDEFSAMTPHSSPTSASGPPHRYTQLRGAIGPTWLWGLGLYETLMLHWLARGASDSHSVVRSGSQGERRDRRMMTQVWISSSHVASRCCCSARQCSM